MINDAIESFVRKNNNTIAGHITAGMIDAIGFAMDDSMTLSEEDREYLSDYICELAAIAAAMHKGSGWAKGGLFDKYFATGNGELQ